MLLSARLPPLEQTEAVSVAVLTSIFYFFMAIIVVGSRLLDLGCCYFQLKGVCLGARAHTYSGSLWSRSLSIVLCSFRSTTLRVYPNLVVGVLIN